MKKLILGMLVFFASLLSAQYNSNNGWGNNDAYGDYNDEYYFPEDYYYEYPSDYYSDGYYQDFYNDYRRSITMVNWNRFFREFALTAYQINMILELNRQFDSYYVWNSYYRMNPVRWYYDRYYALEQILGPRVYVVFQNRYYNGYSPVIYYNNRCRNFYRTRYVVAPRYRSININIYKINKHNYHRSVGNRYGWNQPRNPHNSYRNNDRFRNNPNGNNRGNDRGVSTRTSTRNNNDGFRSATPRTTTRATRSSSVRNTSPRVDNNRSTAITPQRSTSTRSNDRSVRNVSPSTRSNSSVHSNSNRGNSQRSASSNNGRGNGRSMRN